MKHTFLLILLAAGIGLFASLATGEDASVQLGEKLFNDPALGGSKNQQSCGTCHPGGKGLEAAGARSNLAAMINNCIEKPLKGEKIEENALEMKSLILYIKSLDR